MGNIVSSDLLPGIIPGNGGGSSSGRVGHITCLEEANKFVLSYARRKATVSFLESSKSSDVDEMGLVFFDENLKNLKQVVLGQGSFINQIQSAKYGKNIFIAYVTSNRVQSEMLSASIASTDTMSVVLVNQEGAIVNGPIEFTNAILAASDDMRVMNDGRVCWTYVDANFNLNYYYLSKPIETTTNIELVKSISFYKQGTDFYVIDSKDPNVYKTIPSGTMKNNTTPTDSTIIKNLSDGTNNRTNATSNITNGTSNGTNNSTGSSWQLGWTFIGSLILMILAQLI